MSFVRETHKSKIYRELKLTFTVLEIRPADMPDDIYKTPHVTNNSGESSSKNVIQSRHREISHRCECGAASCENCPLASEMKIGPGSDKSYRNVFSYLKIAAVILILTLIVEEALTLLPT